MRGSGDTGPCAGACPGCDKIMGKKDYNQWPKTVTIDVRFCPRCNGSHEGVEYRRFELGDPRDTHWAYCESTGEPLYLNMRRPGTRKEGDKFYVRFVGTGRRSTQPANPNYPQGVDWELPHEDGAPRCKVKLPYPAKEIGAWKVICTKCGAEGACTATGKADDPRTMIMPCKKDDED